MGGNREPNSDGRPGGVAEMAAHGDWPGRILVSCRGTHKALVERPPEKGLMRTKAIFVALLVCSGLAAENLEKTQKKELEAQVKTMTAEAEKLAKAGQLAEARAKYAESQALIEMKDVTEAIKHLDEESTSE
jgi:hypothetical protein